MYLRAAGTQRPTSPWKLGMRCIAAIILVLHWAVPVLNAPQKTVADALQDAVEYSLYQRNVEPGAVSRSGSHGSAVQGSTWKKALEHVKPGEKPVAFPRDEAFSLSPPIAIAFIAVPPSLRVDKPFSAFNARAPPDVA